MLRIDASATCWVGIWYLLGPEDAFVSRGDGDDTRPLQLKLTMHEVQHWYALESEMSRLQSENESANPLTLSPASDYGRKGHLV